MATNPTVEMAGVASAVGDLNEDVGGFMTEIRDAGLAAVASVEKTHEDRIHSMTVQCYVDQQLGDDTAIGTSDSPLKSIQAAVDKTPFGGVCIIFMMNDYHFYDDVNNRHITIDLRSYSTVKPVLTFERYVYESPYGTKYRRLKGINLLYTLSNMSFYNMKIVIPSLDGTWGNYPPDIFSHIVGQRSSGDVIFSVIKLFYCEIEIPENPFCSFASLDMGGIYAYALTIPNQNLQGNLMAGINNTNGTDVNTVSNILSNLSVI